MTKTVLVTGAGAGIGLSCAKIFLESGWHVYAHYRQSEDALRELQKSRGEKNLTLLKADFSVESEVKAFLNGIAALPFKALVNNSATYDLSNSQPDRIKAAKDTFFVNTIVPTLIAETVFEGMKKEGGAIVNVSSIGVKYGSDPKNIFYGASKSGLETVTRTLARAGAPFNILVNTLRPGVTDTSFHAKIGKNTEERKKLIPLKRLGTPEEIAQFIYFLCAENTFMTGEIVTVAGGD
jgi:3-oxoacyl-[acyl-carrier protein] reductase